jgi:hypothetical protein
MAGVTLSFRLRGEDRVGLVYVGDGATSTGAFHEGINFAAVQRCPLVVVVENNGYAYSTPTHKQTLARQFVDKAIGYGIPGVQADGNDVLAVYDAARRAVDAARRGEGTQLVELMTYRRKGHAEHDNQSYVPDGEIERWAAENDPIDRYVARLTGELGFSADEVTAVDARVRALVDEATDVAEASGFPEALDALTGVYADPPAERPLWFREGVEARRRSARARRGVGHVRHEARDQGGGGRRMTTAARPTTGEVTYLEAIREALFEEMARDPSVFCLGEDIGAFGGAFKVTEGLQARFGEQRVIDTPISEIGIVGAAAGSGAHGDASGGRDAVHRLHRERVRHAHQLRGDGALSGLPAVPDGRARPERRLRARRAVPLAEPRGRLHPHPRDSRSSIRRRPRTRRGS